MSVNTHYASYVAQREVHFVQAMHSEDAARAAKRDIIFWLVVTVTGVIITAVTQEWPNLLLVLAGALGTTAGILGYRGHRRDYARHARGVVRCGRMAEAIYQQEEGVS